MAVIIVFAIIALCIAFYFKVKSISNKNSQNILSINSPSNMRFKDYKILDENIILSFENDTKLFINIFNIKTGKNVKKIEILK